jgi:hypothetical protein
MISRPLELSVSPNNDLDQCPSQNRLFSSRKSGGILSGKKSSLYPDQVVAHRESSDAALAQHRFSRLDCWLFSRNHMTWCHCEDTIKEISAHKGQTIPVTMPSKELATRWEGQWEVSMFSLLDQLFDIQRSHVLHESTPAGHVRSRRKSFMFKKNTRESYFTQS